MRYFIQLFSFWTILAQANMTQEGFERFFNYYFVETGIQSGMGIQFALRAGFPEIYSIDIDEYCYENAKIVFQENKNVKVFLGDSGEDLFAIIKDFNRPITFWLDGHASEIIPGLTKLSPILEELDQIKRHHIKHHTILIDDMHCCGTALFNFYTKEDLIAKILEINPKYCITYIDGGDAAEVKDNIMVAYVPYVDWELSDEALWGCNTL